MFTLLGFKQARLNGANGFLVFKLELFDFSNLTISARWQTQFENSRWLNLMAVGDGRGLTKFTDSPIFI